MAELKEIFEMVTNKTEPDVDAWQEQSFSAVAKGYLQRLSIDKNLRCEIDHNGDLLLHHFGKVGPERKKLLPCLAVPVWLDPATRGPRL